MRMKAKCYCTKTRTCVKMVDRWLCVTHILSLRIPTHTHSPPNLGFILDEYRTFSDQISAITKSGHCHQRRCILPYLDSTTVCAITFIVHSLDYCNYRLKEPILHLLWASWTSFSVITFPNRNLSGWNLEYKCGATVRIHTRKMVEIAPGVPPQSAKMCFVFCYQCNAAFLPLILHRFRPFLE